MRRIALSVAAAALIVGPLAAAQTAQAADVAPSDHTVSSAVAPIQGPTVQMFDCRGTTGDMGCGPGWFWRDGWRGFGCYPC